MSNSKIIRSENLIFLTEDPEIFCGYFIEVFSKHGQKFVDGAVRIYWNPFTEVDELISQSAPYETTPLKKWEMSAIFVGFDRINKSWPIGGHSFQEENEIDELSNRIFTFANNDGRFFFDKYASVQGLFNFLIDNGPASPGTWRITLEFLLRERLFGMSSACQYLRERPLRDPTGYERHQQNWILGHKCLAAR